MKRRLRGQRRVVARWLLAGVVPLLGIPLTVVGGVPPAGASEAISGTVVCPDGPVADIWIQAAKGGSGFARVSPAGQADVSYEYSLPNGGAWTVRVGCGIGKKDAWQYTPNALSVRQSPTSIGSASLGDAMVITGVTSPPR